MKCKDLHKLEFTEEQFQGMRDSVYGYNDELACAIFDETVNAGNYVLGHISKPQYNFSKTFDYLYDERFSHEFWHLQLGLSFLKRGKNPLPFEYGYDGNRMAETLVLEAEKFFHTIHFADNTPDKKCFRSAAEFYYTSARYIDVRNSIEAVQLMERKPSLKHVFDARRELYFDDTDVIERKDTPSLMMYYQDTEYEDMVYTGQDIPRDVIDDFF